MKLILTILIIFLTLTTLSWGQEEDLGSAKTQTFEVKSAEAFISPQRLEVYIKKTILAGEIPSFVLGENLTPEMIAEAYKNVLIEIEPQFEKSERNLFKAIRKEAEKKKLLVLPVKYE